MDRILLEKALEMTADERIAFAELILASVDYEEEKIRRAWIAEVNNRITAVNEGKSKLLDFESLLPASDGRCASHITEPRLGKIKESEYGSDSVSGR